VLVVLERSDEHAARASANLQGIKALDVGLLSAYDVLCHEWIVFTTATLPASTATTATRPRPTKPPGRGPKADQAPAADEEVEA